MNVKYLALALLAVIGAMVATPAAVRAEDQKPPAVTQVAPGMKRTPLQKFDVPGTNFETHILRIEFEPNFAVQRHIHPGPEGTYVIAGEITYTLEGQPPLTLKPGDSISIPAGTVHSAKMGPEGSVLIGTYVLEKGKPFLTKTDAAGAAVPATPAPEAPKP